MDSSNSTKKLVVVLGMHRSGTSAITRGLESLGVDLGDNFVPEASDNERGFWEDSEIVNFNEELQSKLGYTWYGGLIADRIDWKQNEVIAAKERAMEILNSKFSHTNIFGFKDPRTAILIEFWVEVFRCLELSVYYLIALRNPLDIAASLYKRNAITKQKSLLLWATSMFQSMLFTRNESRVLTSYDEMLQSPLKQLKRISLALELAALDEKTDSVRYYCDNFLTKNLRHSDFTNFELNNDSDVLSVIADLYTLLLEAATDQISIDSSDFDDRLDLLFTQYTELSPLLKYINSIDDERLVVEAELHKTQTELNDLRHSSALDIKRAYSEIEKMQTSYSWKVTKPLRYISKCILKK